MRPLPRVRRHPTLRCCKSFGPRRNLVAWMVALASTAVFGALALRWLLLQRGGPRFGASASSWLYSRPPVLPEAAFIAVHVRSSLSTDPVERLAALRLAEVRRATFTSRDGAGRETRRVLEPRVVFENAPRAPLSRDDIDAWLGHPNLEFVEASRVEERARLGPAFDTFSGIYGAAVKARVLRWLAESSAHDRAWVLEPDCVYTGASWVEFFQAYDERYPDHDLIAADSTKSTGGAAWAHAASCTYCAEGDGRWRTAFLPVFRVSKRLARAVIDELARNATGHHEAFIPTVCSRLPGCQWAPVDGGGGVFRYRPFLKKDEARSKKATGKLYHPVKSAEVFRELVNRTYE